MGIYIRCTKCKSDHKLGCKVCKKCTASLATNKKYKVVVKTLDGKRTVRHVDTLNLARRVENSLKGQVAERKILGVKKAPYLSDVWSLFINWAKKNKKSWKDDLFRWEKHVAPYIGDKKMDAINPSDIQKILDRMDETGGKSNNGYAPATKKHVLVLIKRVYNWADQLEHYTGSNPAKKIKPPRVQNQVTECLNKGELERLLNTLEVWPNQLGALLVKFSLYTGFRQDEIMGLEWKDVDQENGFISLFDPKGKPATLPLSQEALKIIHEAEKIKPFEGCLYVFPNQFGERRVSFYKIWSRIRNAAGLPKTFRFHGLRHTFASYLASSGEVDLYTLQKLLNHQSPQMTQRYAHLLDETLRRGAGVADKVFNNLK
ncbi:Integrase superfamily protein [Desulfonema limicola]|uniref:Integrase superfamily protein n=1 Tax=Desulfonema limicola TaxID=45656 RepID=A0A975GEM5_9BACT|nr:site-specific integrase [Desulfonema limicola]QTA78386.1 Integrase superfamily protein [Desulfonema limicola]